MQPARFVLPPPPAPLPEPVRRREGGAAGGGHRTAFEPVPITVQPPRQHTVTLDEAVGGGPGAGVVHAGGSGSVAVVWYRADLRVADHASLLAGVRAAAGDGGALLPLFVWVGECDFMGGCVLCDGTAAARDALADLAPQGGYAARREWMLSCLCRLDRQLRTLGSRLCVLRVRAFEDVPKAVAVSAFREGVVRRRARRCVSLPAAHALLCIRRMRQPAYMRPRCTPRAALTLSRTLSTRASPNCWRRAGCVCGARRGSE